MTSTATKLLGVLRQLGQVPFYPPNVGGWPSGQAWLSTAAADARMQAAMMLAGDGDLSSVSQASSAARIDAVGYLLGVGSWSARSVAVLEGERRQPGRPRRDRAEHPRVPGALKGQAWTQSPAGGS